MSAWDSPIIRVSTGRLSTVNGALIGGVSGNAAGFSKYAGQLGKTVWFNTDQMPSMFDSTVGTLYMGRYRYVRMRDGDDDSPAVAIGQILYWDTVVANWESAYQVTRDSNLSSVDEGVMIAGIYLGTLTGGNYGFIQDLGEASVLFRASLTVAGAIGSRVYDAGAGAGVDEGLADVLTADATSLINAHYLGAAVNAPVAATLSRVLLNFNNAVTVA